MCGVQDLGFFIIGMLNGKKNKGRKKKERKGRKGMEGEGGEERKGKEGNNHPVYRLSTGRTMYIYRIYLICL